jgi:hypothetical protein
MASLSDQTSCFAEGDRVEPGMPLVEDHPHRLMQSYSHPRLRKDRRLGCVSKCNGMVQNDNSPAR